MLRRNRSKKRLDYLILTRTGERVEKVQIDQRSEEYNMSGDESDTIKQDVAGASDPSTGEKARLVLQVLALNDDIVDFLEENPINDIRDSLSDVDFVIQRTEEFRSVYRSKFKEVAMIHGDHDMKAGHDSIINLMKK